MNNYSCEDVRAKLELYAPTGTYTQSAEPPADALKPGGVEKHRVRERYSVNTGTDADVSSRRDNSGKYANTAPMTDLSRKEMNTTLSAIEERMDKRIDRMEKAEERRADDFRNELSLRDAQLQREIDIRQESFRAEQAARDAALSEKFAGFLAAQAERDKAWEKISESRFERIEKDVSSIKADTKKVGEDVNGIKVTMGKYLGGAIVIGAIASALLGVALKYVFSTFHP